MNPSPFPAKPAAAALAWLGRVVDDLGDGAEDLELALGAEVCAAICADASPGLVPSARKLVARTRSLAAGAFERLGARAFDLPGLLLLLAAATESAASGEPIKPLAEYVRTAAAALCTPSSMAELDGYLAPRLLLSRLGQPGGAGRAADALPLGLGHVLLRQPATLKDSLDRIESFCQFGLCQVSAPRSLSRHLGAVLLCRLQEYDLETASRVLRTLIYLGKREEPSLLSLGSRFLLAQQTEEGSFGFLERECASLKRRLPDSRADLRFRLGITTCVLWTLAELHGKGYRLLRDLGRGFTAAPSASGSPARRRETA